MQRDEAERFIAENVVVTRQKVAIMKGLIFRHGTFEGALRELDIVRPPTIVLHQSTELPLLEKSSEWISYSLAGCEAVWELVHSCLLVQVSEALSLFKATIDYTDRNYSSAWYFEQFGNFRSAYPTHCVRSSVSDRHQVLADADLYLQKLSLPMIHPEVEEALRDSVRCFRADLFVPSVVMLGKASEGAWIEFGVSLAEFVGFSDIKVKKWADTLVGPEIGFAKKLRDILTFYETRQATFKPLAQQVGITLEDLRTAVLWSDTLRDARNAIHHRVSSSTDASYEIVATLLLAATPHLQTVYSLYKAVKNAGLQPSGSPSTP